MRANLETNKLSKNVDPCACANRAKNQFLIGGKRWDISREKFLITFIVLSRQDVVPIWWIENSVAAYIVVPRTEDV